METVNTYLGPDSIDAATLIVGLVFLTVFIAEATLLARHHLGIATAIVGGGVWLLSGLLLANEQALLGSLAAMMGVSGTGISLEVVQRAHQMSPMAVGIGVVIAVGSVVRHHIESASAPTYEPLEEQRDPEAHYPSAGHTA